MNGLISEEYLIHYGVKGMKWGVRHDPERIGRNRAQRADDKYRSKYSETGRKKHNAQWYKTASDEQIRSERRKKAAKKIAIGAAFLLAAGLVAYGAYNGSSEWSPKVSIGKKQNAESFSDTLKKITKSENDFDGFVAGGGFGFNRKGRQLASKPISELSNKDTQFGKDYIFKRINWGDKDDLSSVNKLYVNPNMKDAAWYRKYLGKSGNDQFGEKYENIFAAKKQLSAPSERKRVMAFMGLMTDKKFREAYISDIKNSERPGVRQIAYQPAFMDMDTKNSRQYYDLFVGLIADKKSKSGKMYYDKLKTMGYEALSDDNDAGFLARTPAMILDPSNNIVLKGRQRVDDYGELIGKFKV